MIPVLRPAAWLGAIAVLATACGSGTAPAASPSPTAATSSPTPAPSPSPTAEPSEEASPEPIAFELTDRQPRDEGEEEALALVRKTVDDTVASFEGDLDVHEAMQRLADAMTAAGLQLVAIGDNPDQAGVQLVRYPGRGCVVYGFHTSSQTAFVHPAGDGAPPRFGPVRESLVCGPDALDGIVIAPVPYGELNSAFGVSRIHFPAVAQSIRVDAPFTLTAVRVPFTDASVVPDQYDLADPDVIAQSIRDWEPIGRQEQQLLSHHRVDVTLTVRVWAAPEGTEIGDQVDVAAEGFELVAEGTRPGPAEMPSELAVIFGEGVRLEAGHYLVELHFTFANEGGANVHVLQIPAAQHGGPEVDYDPELDTYLPGQAYRVEDGDPYVPNRHSTRFFVHEAKVTELVVVGQRGGGEWRGGDMQIFLHGTND